MGRKGHDGLAVVHPAGRSDAHRLRPVMGSQSLNGGQDRFLDRARAVRGCRLLQPLEDDAVFIHCSGRDLGATDVDSNADGRRLGWPLCAANPRDRGAGQLSTLLFSPESAPSMMVFSALRLNIPIMGKFTSTVSVYVTVVPPPFS